jgi:hypothetical protein
MYAANASWLWWNATNDATDDATNAVSDVSFDLQQEMYGYMPACLLHKISCKTGKR